MQKNLLFVALLISIMLCACDKIPCITYEIHNNTSGSMRVIRAIENDSYDEKRVDTFDIAAGETKAIAAKKDHVTGAVHYNLNKIMEYDDTIRYIQVLHVYKNDTTESPKYFLLKSNWAFEKEASFLGSYTLYISDNDF